MFKYIAARIFNSGSKRKHQTVCIDVFRGRANSVSPAFAAKSAAADNPPASERYSRQNEAGDARQNEAVDTDMLDLDDHEKAFAFRTTPEIARALFVFKLCSYPLLVDNSLKLMEVGKRILPDRLYTKLMTCTVGGQFVGGETTKELLVTAAHMRKAGIRPLLFLPVEEDVGSSEYRSEPYDRNLKALLHCLTLAKQLGQSLPMAQMKLTSLVPANICASLSTIVLKADREHAYLDNIIRVLDGGDLELSGLTSAERGVLHQSLTRVKALGEHAESLNVRLLVDAEYTYLNPALRLIAVAMMVRYNRQYPLVAYTYQNYLKETFNSFLADETLVRSRGACFGAKLVRGAYMVWERKMADTRGYPDPVHDCFDDTTRMYHQSVSYILDKVSKDPGRYLVMVASHNEDTVRFVLKQMKLRGISKEVDSVVFGQIYGMSDHLSYALSRADCSVFKSIPYGPMETCLPYLQRRAVENSTVLGATGKERQLLWKALVGRFRLRGAYHHNHAT